MNSSRRSELIKCLDAKFSKYVFVDEYGKNGTNHHIHCMFEANDKRTSNYTTFFKTKLYSDLDLTQKKYSKLIITKSVPDKGTLINTYFLKETNAQLVIKGYTLEEIKSWPAKPLIGKPVSFTTLSACKATEKIFKNVKASGICQLEPLTERQLYYQLQYILIGESMTYSHLSEKQLNNILDEVNCLLGYGKFVVEKKFQPDWDWKKEREFLEYERRGIPKSMEPTSAPPEIGGLVIPDMDELISLKI